MPTGQLAGGCCDRCPRAADGPRTLTPLPGAASAVSAGVAGAGAVSRRRLLKAAVFPARASQSPLPGASGGAHLGGGPRATSAAASGAARAAGGAARATGAEPGALGSDPASAGFADLGVLPRAVSGRVLEVSPQVLVLGDENAQQRYVLTPDATAWRGALLEPVAVRPGDHAVVRLLPSSRRVADRVWANIGRVTGIIAERSGSTLIVDEGATRARRVVSIRERALGRIQVRFPTLEPGYLVDIIGLRRDGELDGMIPATSQPAYPASRLPHPPLVSGHVPDAISGSATWHEPIDEPPGVLGVCYPALDPETGCGEDEAHGHTHGYARMPYLAIGSVLRVRNECTGLDCMLPVTGCAPVARLFNDRCVTCGTSPRGRIADLTMASFVALGGELDRGCFNATIRIGE
jgi:hypothetical protein